MKMDEINTSASNFIYDFIDEDLKNGVNTRVQTRFPPEPNGYLHIGHAKAICIDFSTAEKYGGECNLRLDDTNPSKEDVEYVDAIKEDIEWLGYKWNKVLYASSYFDFIYECAIKLIKKGKAYVCDLSADEIREYRGTLTEPGKNSPYRERSIEENLDLFARMTAGEFKDGEKTLRAKIDMSSPNINMRDPVIYRIAHVHHHQTGDKWCVYPMYDFAHPLSDAKEGVTYSLCSLEFENHRPLYDWFIKEIGFDEPPRQIEFARLNINYCVTSKRKCLEMVKKGIVDGWDDPRMVTLCGMRRRGYPAAAIREFINRIGVSKAYSVVDYGLLEACVRDNLNANAPRAMAVLRPLKVIIDNYPEGQTEAIEVEINPDKPSSAQGRCISQGRYSSSATTSWLSRRRNISGSSPAMKFASRARISLPAPAGKPMTTATSPACTAPMTPPPRAATHPTAGRSGAPSTGSAPRTAQSAKYAFTTVCSTPRTPQARRASITSII